MKIPFYPFLLLSCCVLLLGLYSGCGEPASQQSPVEVTDGYFEGEIKLEKTGSINGSLFKVEVSYLISENRIRREERMGGINTLLNNYAGMVVDLETDSVILYYSDPFQKKKHSLSIADLTALYRTEHVYTHSPAPIDHTFHVLESYQADHFVKDSTEIAGLKADYSHYTSKLVDQHVFDTKDLRIKRKLLEMVCIHLPKQTHFPLRSEIKTKVAQVENDSIIQSEPVRDLRKLVRILTNQEDSTPSSQAKEEDDLSDSKLVNKGLDILKKGVDWSSYMSTDLVEIKSRKVTPGEVVLPGGKFDEVNTFLLFLAILAASGSYDN